MLAITFIVTMGCSFLVGCIALFGGRDCGWDRLMRMLETTADIKAKKEIQIEQIKLKMLEPNNK